MPKIVINQKRCKGCLLCVNFCPKNLIRVSGSLNNYGINPAELLNEKNCLGCGQCAIICPDCCITVYK